MKLDTYIASLLEQHDCVIIPDFGGFVANYAPAKINPVNNRFDPPHKRISFNKLLTHNDGLLAAYVARTEQERFEKSLLRLKDYAIYLKSEIRDHKKAVFESIGVLYQNGDGTFRFEQIKNEAFFMEGFGLESFFARKINAETLQFEEQRMELGPIPEEVPVVQAEPAVISIAPETSPIITLAQKPKRQYYKAMAAGMAIPIVGYALYLALGTSLITNKSGFHYSDLNPFSDKEAGIYLERTNLESSKQADDEAETLTQDTGEFVVLRNENAPDKTLVVRLTEAKKAVAAIETSELKYHIIGGCFGVEENASNLAETYTIKGSNASIIDQKGSLYRVSVGSFATKKEAMQALTSYRNDIPNAWILHK